MSLPSGLFHNKSGVINVENMLFQSFENMVTAAAHTTDSDPQSEGTEMSPKTLLNVTIGLMLLHGLGLIFGASDAAKMGIENISADALNMGKGAYEIAAFFNLFLVAVLVSARKLEATALRSLSKGIAIGYVVLTAGVIYHIFTLIPGQAPPAAAGGIFGAIAAWAVVVAFVAKDDGAAAA